MKCTWCDDEIDCHEEAIEKWTDIPFIDPYCGPFYSSAADEPFPDINYICAIHTKISRDIWIKAALGDIAKATFNMNQAYKIEKL